MHTIPSSPVYSVFTQSRVKVGGFERAYASAKTKVLAIIPRDKQRTKNARNIKCILCIIFKSSRRGRGVLIKEMFMQNIETEKAHFFPNNWVLMAVKKLRDTIFISLIYSIEALFLSTRRGRGCARIMFRHNQRPTPKHNGPIKA